MENLEELVNAARLFDATAIGDIEDEEGLSELDMFLAHATLESGELQGDDYDDCVQLMTLHSAKVLEFKQVFLVGMEEGLFPTHKTSRRKRLPDRVFLTSEARWQHIAVRIAELAATGRAVLVGTRR